MLDEFGSLASLTLRISQRDFSAKYKGSTLGLLWSVVTPLAMLAVYTFIFTYVFRSTWTGINGTSQYALNIFVGLIFHLQLIETFGASSASIVGNPNYIKKVVFPVGILPLAKVVTIFIHTLISVVVLFIFYAFINNGFFLLGMLNFLIVVILHTLMCLGLAWSIAAVGVYVRDISHALSLFSMLLLFMSPIFYSIEMVPEEFRWIMNFNPNTLFINKGRNALLSGELLSISSVFWIFCVTSLFCFVSYRFFKYLKKGFADVL